MLIRQLTFNLLILASLIGLFMFSFIFSLLYQKLFSTFYQTVPLEILSDYIIYGGLSVSFFLLNLYSIRKNKLSGYMITNIFNYLFFLNSYNINNDIIIDRLMYLIIYSSLELLLCNIIYKRIHFYFDDIH